MNSNIRNTNKNMGKIVSKFQIDMLYGKPVIKMLDNLNSIAKSIIVVESDSLSRNIDQVLSHVYDEHKSFSEGFEVDLGKRFLSNIKICKSCALNVYKDLGSFFIPKGIKNKNLEIKEIDKNF